MLHDRLKAMRKQRGLKLRQLSAATGLSVSFLSEIERERANPSMETLQRLADYYQSNILIVITPSNRSAT